MFSNDRDVTNIVEIIYQISGETNYCLFLTVLLTFLRPPKLGTQGLYMFFLFFAIKRSLFSEMKYTSEDLPITNPTNDI